MQITEEFEEVPVQSRGFGILDVGYRSTVKFYCIQRVALLMKMLFLSEKFFVDVTQMNMIDQAAVTTKLLHKPQFLGAK